jgi:hypothetical protein
MVYRFLFILMVAFPAHAESVSIMAFNVENLFDNTHDESKNDETYLPFAKKNRNNTSTNAMRSRFSVGEINASTGIGTIRCWLQNFR